MAIVATANSQAGWVTISGGAFTLIEGSSDGGVTYTTLYSGASVTTRNVYPNTEVAMTYRVGGVVISPNPTTLPAHGAEHIRRLWLNSRDDATLKVAFGPTPNPSSSNHFTPLKDSIELIAGGQVDSTWAESIHTQYAAGSEQWTMYAYQLEDGTRQKPYPLCLAVVRMHLEGHHCLWRDHLGNQRPVRVFNSDIVQLSGVHFQINFAMKTEVAPTLPFSS